MERRSLPCDLIDFARTVVTQRVDGLNRPGGIWARVYRPSLTG